jgi:hypothetical protein
VICETHEPNYGAYGSRRTWKALRRAGETAPHCRVQGLMREHGFRARSGAGSPGRTAELERREARPLTEARSRHIPRRDPAHDHVDRELVTIEKIAEMLGFVPPRSTGGSRSGSLPASKTLPARHGGSASTTSCAPASSRTRHPAG